MKSGRVPSYARFLTFPVLLLTSQIFLNQGQYLSHLERFGEKIIRPNIPGDLTRVFMS